MAAKVMIPQYQATALEAIPVIAKKVRETFSTHKTKNLEWRLVQLRKLYWAITDLTPQIIEAMHRDLHKSAFESTLAEIDLVKSECMYQIKHLKEFAADEKIKDVPLTYSLMNCRIRKEPLGAALIISAYNYPILLLLAPFVGAIAAGCTVVLKPAEAAPATAMVVVDILSRLDHDAYAVVNGAVPETTALLNEKWDKIFYTGSAQVGTIIAKKAAETLTPVVLELGGRNPAFVTKNADVKLAARRLLWGKAHNAGQVCLSHNYILVEKEVLQPLIDALNASFRDFFPNGAKASPDLSRIINLRQFQRIKKMLDTTKGKIVMGGQTDETELFIEPTAVLVDSMDDSMMVEESFGPIFAIYPVNSLDEALNVANRVHRTPLSLFAFGSKAENKRILNEMTSGGASINDSYMHGSIGANPFGGVGDSGTGAYHGKASFDVFSHARTVTETPGWVEGFLRVRYMPYSWPDLRRLMKINGAKPDFDRDGKVVRGLGYWVGMVLGLGGGSAKGALVRWFLVLLAGWGYVARKGV
ncbi:aldehyde dehydrogenase [Coniochaeta ligniaria NRRL 30616]|uniref:Aldehyde dehydrogenase n=1 Tax=Coniochaeta ligniaria NRRL 30616 TaxID=1408157 RepID=A0A1J7INC1_9PEZI|nr:aldehyde dehydrogenase [Coniochaeta ligniaria NRRL 30616]